MAERSVADWEIVRAYPLNPEGPDDEAHPSGKSESGNDS